jgi:dolichol-phosphate mannosyltransferase
MFDLAVVMPVYNEKDCIIAVINSWLSVLSGLNINFRIIVLNDGSLDGTDRILETFKVHPQVEIINKPNSGHGPTILMGYGQAVRIAGWVFQCDSDNELSAEHFPHLWKERHAYEAIFGIRKDRKQSISRKIITACARLSVKFFFGRGISDVNIPYRLIRADILQQIISRIPPDTFAPNIVISGMLPVQGARIYEYPVPYGGRKTGKSSIGKWKLWKAAFKSFGQILSRRKSFKKAK